MPYRRLPNTDQARLRAMRQAYSKIENASYDQDIAIPYDLQYKLKVLYPRFEQAVDLYRQSYKRQIDNSKTYKKDLKMAKLYISHFFQVLNMAVQRGEFSVKDKEYFGLAPDMTTVPRLTTENDIIRWGKAIIEGEQKRIQMGRSPVQFPRASMVKVYYERFADSYYYYKKSQEITANNLKGVAQLRPEVDRLIQRIWNAVEEYYSDLSPELMREKAKQYGVVYVYRKSELRAQQIMQ